MRSPLEAGAEPLALFLWSCAAEKVTPTRRVRRGGPDRPAPYRRVSLGPLSRLTFFFSSQRLTAQHAYNHARIAAQDPDMFVFKAGMMISREKKNPNVTSQSTATAPASRQMSSMQADDQGKCRRRSSL